MPHFAANLSIMSTEVPFIERFAVTRKAGFSAVEFLLPYDYPILRIQKQLEQNHLTLALFNTASGDTNTREWGLSALPGREYETRTDIDLALEYALTLNCEQVHVMADVVPADGDAERYRTVFIDNLRYAVGRFTLYDKRILAEALSPDVRPHYLFSSQCQALATVEEVARGNVFIRLGTFHAQRIGGNLAYLIRDYTGKHAHVQTAELPDRHEPDDEEINYPWLFHLLNEMGCQNRIGCEYKPRSLTEEGLGWFDAWR